MFREQFLYKGLLRYKQVLFHLLMELILITFIDLYLGFYSKFTIMIRLEYSDLCIVQFKSHYYKKFPFFVNIHFWGTTYKSKFGTIDQLHLSQGQIHDQSSHHLKVGIFNLRLYSTVIS